MHDYTWSPDGKWLAYSKGRDNQLPGIWLYSLDSGKATLVSSPIDADFNPAFDPDGKYLYFVSARHENPTFSQSEFNIATLKMCGHLRRHPGQGRSLRPSRRAPTRACRRRTTRVTRATRTRRRPSPCTSTWTA